MKKTEENPENEFFVRKTVFFLRPDQNFIIKKKEKINKQTWNVQENQLKTNEKLKINKDQ